MFPNEFSCKQARSNDHMASQSFRLLNIAFSKKKCIVLIMEHDFSGVDEQNITLYVDEEIGIIIVNILVNSNFDF